MSHSNKFSIPLNDKSSKALVDKQLADSNFQRLKFATLLLLGFSVFALITDYTPVNIWNKDHIDLYRILDSILFGFSLFSIIYLWYLIPDRPVLKNKCLAVYLILSVGWTGFLAGIDFSNTGFPTFLFVLITISFIFYLDSQILTALFLTGFLSLLISITLFGEIDKTNIDKLFTLIPISSIAFLLARKNYNQKKNELSQRLELSKLNDALVASKENLEDKIKHRTNALTSALTKLSRQQDELEQANFRFSELIKNLQSGIFYVNTQGEILETNPAMLKILGSPSEEKTKQINLFEFKPLLEIGYSEKLKECIEQDKIINGEAIYKSIWGKKAIVNYYFAPIKKEGKVVGALANNEDVTTEREAEERLAEMNNALQRQNDEFEALNEELMQTNDELFEAKEKAEESDRLKSVFLNNMSHEIRTPLNGIVGFSGILARRNLSPEKKNNYITIIKNSSDQLLRIIDDILEISFLETKQAKVYKEEIHIRDFLIELHTIFNLKAKERGISLRLINDLTNDNCIIYTDKSKLNKILSNLIENSLKYTSEGYVNIRCALENDFIKLSVEDSGVGIDPVNHKRIFRRFEQESTEISKRKGGLGIGLSIVEENTRILGGKVLLESEKGKGATFTVTLPMHEK